MAAEQSQVLVTFSPPAEVGPALDEVLSGLAEVTYLPDVGRDGRAAALDAADAVFAWQLGSELNGSEEFARLASTGLIQLLSAGVNGVPFGRIPDGVPVASNAGAYAEPIAEHVLAMALALAKRLPQNHAAMACGEFDQETPTREIRGATVGILGYGGIGRASATLFKALGATIHAIGRSSRSAEPPADWTGTMADLDALLAAADVLVVSLPLSRETRGLIGARELALMKRDAVIVNVARGPILDEDALYDHLRANPDFSAGLDTWCEEPEPGEQFSPRLPFLELPNVLGSPHNSGLTPGTMGAAARHAAENIARHLRGQPVRHLVDRTEYTA